MNSNSLRLLAFGAVVALSVSVHAQDADPSLKAKVTRLSAIAIDGNPNLAYNPYTLLVKFRPGTSESQKAMARYAFSGKVLDRFAVVPGLELLSTNVDPAVAAQWVSTMPGVEYAEVDHIVRNNVVPNDPSFSTLWGLRNTGQSGGTAGADIKATSAWDVYTGSATTVMAVIDSGVQRDHPDLLANAWVNPDEIPGNGIDDDANGLIDDMHGWDYVNNDNNPADDNSHGTHCAGTIGAVGNNGVGITGVTWNVKIVGLKFLSSGGSGSTSNAVKAVDYCFRKKIRISNNSWGGGGYSSSLYNAINNAKSIGHLFIAAAGNSNRDNDATAHYPSSYNLDNIVAVASIDRLDARSSFSNWGATSVDIGAPGSSIYSTVPGSTYGTKSGTSMATPHVAGAASLILSYRPGWTYQQIRDAMYSTVRVTPAMTGRVTTNGVLHLGAVMAMIQGLPNNAPTVNITAPSTSLTVALGASVSLAGNATDPEHGSLTAQLQWISNRDGVIGSGAGVTTSALSAGVHTIRATVTDPDGATSEKTVTVTVEDPLPSAPSNIAAARVSRTLVNVTWSDNSNNETGFEIERQFLDVVNGWQAPTTFNVAAGATSLSDTPGKGTFRYRVRAKNGSGSSAWSSYAQI